MGECEHALTLACANRSEDDFSIGPQLPPFLGRVHPTPDGAASVQWASWHFNFWVFVCLYLSSCYR